MDGIRTGQGGEGWRSRDSKSPEETSLPTTSDKGLQRCRETFGKAQIDADNEAQYGEICTTAPAPCSPLSDRPPPFLPTFTSFSFFWPATLSIHYSADNLGPHQERQSSYENVLLLPCAACPSLVCPLLNGGLERTLQPGQPKFSLRDDSEGCPLLWGSLRSIKSQREYIEFRGEGGAKRGKVGRGHQGFQISGDR